MTGSVEVWHIRRAAARALVQAAGAISLRPGAVTVTGAQSLVDALDHYWQAQYGGRVIVVAPPEEGR